MSDEVAAAWTSGLSRTYSEHADLVLQHYEHHRRRLEAPKCTRSGPEFRSEAPPRNPNIADGNDGQHTWRISRSTSEEDQHRRRNAIESGCGDSSALLTAELSELSLSQHRIYENERAMKVSSSSLSRNTVASSVEHRCRLFDEEEDDADFRLIDLDDEEHPEYRLEDYRREMENVRQATSSTGKHQRLNGAPLERQISYEDWAREKRSELQRRREEMRRAAELRLAAEEREKQAREEHERQEYENYLRWMERKRVEERKRRSMLANKELELQRHIEDFEERAKVIKNISIGQWHRKKVEQMKATQKEEMMKRKKAKEEKERRLQESMKAYEKWREKSKNAPRPATQGLLPHQTVKPAFTNPTPWQPLVDNRSDEDSDHAKPTIPSAKQSSTSMKINEVKKPNIRR